MRASLRGHFQSPVEQATLDVLSQNLRGMLADYDAAHPPVTIDDVVDIIQKLASMFGSNAPDLEGAKLYFLAMAKMPRTLLAAAMIRVAASHKYATLPLPADLMKAVESEIKHMRWQRSRIAEALAIVEDGRIYNYRQAGMEEEADALAAVARNIVIWKDPDKEYLGV